LRQAEKTVDHFTSRPHRAYAEIETLEEMAPALHAIRVCLKLGMYEEAQAIYSTDVASVLLYNLEATSEMIELLQPLFHQGWGDRPAIKNKYEASILAKDAGHALQYSGQYEDAEFAYSVTLEIDLKEENWDELETTINSFGHLFEDKLSLHRALTLYQMACYIAEEGAASVEHIAVAKDNLAACQAKLGNWKAAVLEHPTTDQHPARHRRHLYRPGKMEYLNAYFAFLRNEDPSSRIARAMTVAREGQNRRAVRFLHTVQGDWNVTQQEWPQARDAYHEAVRLARERNLLDANSETGLALAKQQLGELPDAREEALRLAQLRKPAHYMLALLWQAIGDLDQARHHAQLAYRQYWGDGEPYVFRYWLDRTTELLHTLGAPIPQLPPFDPASVQPFPWETKVRAAIERLRAEKAAKAANTDANDDIPPAADE
jgi:tetratricopeptide (TPR) repeat protein